MLVELWQRNKSDTEQKHIQQIVAFAGDGKLRGGSQCAKEVREYLARVDIEVLSRYVHQCLEKSFADSGLVLQDLINELGRRLDYEVEDGFYQGRSNTIGFDGLWRAPDGSQIIVEVKTTDTYRISLETLAKYKDKLIAENRVTTPSILIVVGRDDTGDLEAQVRGSRYAWDIRIISAEALLLLAKVKVDADDETALKMRQLLRPMEYTRLDDLVNIIYTTALDASGATESAEILENDGRGLSTNTRKYESGWEFTNAKVLDQYRDRSVAKLGERLGISFLKKTRASFWTSDRDFRCVCTVSKRYDREGQRYWYAYHPKWESWLAEAKTAYLILSCIELDFAFALPREDVLPILDKLNTTEKEDRFYWHIIIAEMPDGSYHLNLPKNSSTFDLTPYRLKL